MNIVGIDYSADPKRVGLAYAAFDGKTAEILEVKAGNDKPGTIRIIEGWIKHGDPVLLAVDSPLGWPEKLHLALARHRAGEPLPTPANEMFLRLTDDKKRIGKWPLAVGADKIARTAYAFLRELGEIRENTRRPIPLAWDPVGLDTTSVIEVYPAATLLAAGCKPGKGNWPEIEKLGDLRISSDIRGLCDTEHKMDALVCVAAGVDFLKGRCRNPDQNIIAQAQIEGWIWVRRADHS